jgi:hypothetical protein
MLHGFAVTEDHLKLLRHAWADSWHDSEEVYGGAPGINPKKPYGNSWIEHDIADILDIPSGDWDWENADENPPVEMGERLMRLHVETMVALQIVLATGESTPAPTGATPQGPSTGDVTRTVSSCPTENGWWMASGGARPAGLLPQADSD